MRKVNVVVKQDPEAPIAAEIIATAIIKIAEAARAMMSAGLRQETIVTLIHARSGVGKRDIELVLNNLTGLRAAWTTR